MVETAGYVMASLSKANLQYVPSYNTTVNYIAHTVTINWMQTMMPINIHKWIHSLLLVHVITKRCLLGTDSAIITFL